MSSQTRTFIWILLAVVILISAGLYYILFIQGGTGEKIRNVGTDLSISTQATSTGSSTPVNIGTSSSTASTTVDSLYAGDYATFANLYINTLIKAKKDWKIHQNPESGFSIKYPKDGSASIVSGYQTYIALKLPKPENISTEDKTINVVGNQLAIYANAQVAQSNQTECFKPAPDISDSDYVAVGNQQLLRVGPYNVYKQKNKLEAADWDTFLIEYSFYAQSQVCYKSRLMYQTKHGAELSTEQHEDVDTAELNFHRLAEEIISTLTIN